LIWEVCASGQWNSEDTSITANSRPGYV